jgi:hypothetical protein
MMAFLPGVLHSVVCADTEQRMGSLEAALILQGSIRGFLSRMEKKFVFIGMIQEDVQQRYNPRIRMDRYSYYTIQHTASPYGNNQLGLYSYYLSLGQNMILSGSMPQFSLIVSGLLSFREIYSSQLCPVLIDADMLFMKIQTIFLSPNLFRIQDHAEELGMVASSILHQATIFESALFLIDQGLYWMWAASLVEPGTNEPAPPPMDFRIPICRLRAELIPRAGALIQALTDTLAQ